jgi:replicative DNA helicase
MFETPPEGLRRFDPEEALAWLRHLYKNPGNVGLSTGFEKLDLFVGGFKPGELIVEAARPGMGKTAHALCCAINVALGGKWVDVFSQEMSHRQLLWRMAGIVSGISPKAIERGFYLRGEERYAVPEEDYVTFANGIKAVSDLPIRVFDAALTTEIMVKEIERGFSNGEPPALVIDDYLQLHVDKGSENETERISEISRTIKAMTLHFNIPILLISQLNRAVEIRGGDYTPQLSDLRSSGSIEQDADQVWFLKRADYYNPSGDTKSDGRAEVIIAKNRNGELGVVPLHFDRRTTRFSTWHSTSGSGVAGHARTS